MISSLGRRFGERGSQGRTLFLMGLSYVLGVVLLLFVLAEVLGERGTPMLVVATVVPLVPFLLALAFSGRLSKLAASRSGFEILFAEAVTKAIRPFELEGEIIEVTPGGIEGIVAGYDVEAGDVEHRTVLRFQLGEWPDPGAVDEFVANMPRLAFVIFTDPLGQFRGLMSANDFRSVYSVNSAAFLERVEYENVLDINGVVTETISPATTNAEALEKMADRDVDKLGVLDDDGAFVGVITQDAISRGILLDLFDQTEH